MIAEPDLQDQTEEFRAYPKSVQPGIPNLGIVPDGWLRLPIGDLLTVVQRPAKLVGDEFYELVTARRNRGGIVARGRLVGRQIATKTQFWVKAGDFVMSRRQIAHGACGILPDALDGSIVSNEYAALLPTNNLDRGFLRHLPHSIYFQQTCFHSSVGVHVEKLVFNLEHWLTWEFRVPPLPEQQRIAVVLDAWDAAIATAKRLIEVNLAMRDNLEKQLVGAGSATKLTVIADVVFSGVDKRIVEGEQQVRLCNYMDVLNNRRLFNSLPFSAGSATKLEVARFSLQRDDVVFTKDSETASEIAEPACVAEDLEGVVCGYHLAVARPRDGYSGAFLAHAIRSPRLRQQFVKRANGAIRFGLTLDAIEQVELPMPPYERQQLIADTLDCADMEAIRHRQLIAQLRNQKRGLMQLLLTGNLRVPESIDALMPSAPALEAA